MSGPVKGSNHHDLYACSSHVGSFYVEPELLVLYVAPFASFSSKSWSILEVQHTPRYVCCLFTLGKPLQRPFQVQRKRLDKFVFHDTV